MKSRGCFKDSRFFKKRKVRLWLPHKKDYFGLGVNCITYLYIIIYIKEGNRQLKKCEYMMNMIELKKYRRGLTHLIVPCE